MQPIKHRASLTLHKQNFKIRIHFGTFTLKKGIIYVRMNMIRCFETNFLSSEQNLDIKFKFGRIFYKKYGWIIIFFFSFPKWNIARKWSKIVLPRQGK